MASGRTRLLRNEAARSLRGLIAEIDQYLEGDDKEGDDARVDNVNIDGIRTMLDLLAEEDEIVRNTNQEVLESIPDEEEEMINQELTVHGELRRAVARTRCKLKRRQEAIAGVNASNATQVPVFVPTGSNTSVKLPPLELTTFSGKFSEYFTWRQQFDAMIDKSYLPIISKFSYLLRYTEGKARAKIKGLQFKEENYQGALNILENTFGVVQFAIDEVIGQFKQLKPIKDDCDTASLTVFCDFIESNVLTLESLGVDANSYALVIFTEVLGCLPQTWGEQFEEYHNRVTCNHPPEMAPLFEEHKEDGSAVSSHTLERAREFKILQSFLAQKVTALVKYGAARNARDNRRSTEAKKDGGMHPRDASFSGSSSRTFNRNSRNQRQTTVQFPGRSSDKEVCVFCEKDHETSVCDTPMSFKERSRRIKDAKACFKCLKVTNPPHWGYRCRMAKKVCCENCSKGHYTVLHREEESPKNSDSLNGTASCAQTTAATVNTYTFLKTATANVMAGGKQVKVRIFLDDGCQKSFVSRRLCRRLKPKCLRKETLAVKGFGSAPTQRCKSRVVEVTLHSLHGDNKVTLPLYEIEDLGVQLSERASAALLESVEKLKLSLADKFVTGVDAPDMLDILIGSDHLALVELGEVYPLLGGVQGISTIFGVCLRGNYQGDSTGAIIASPCSTRTVADLDAFWSLDHMGISEPYLEKSATERNDGIVRDFEASITCTQNRYEVKLPVREELLDQLHTGSGTAEKRLQRTMKSLAQTPERFQQYQRCLSVLWDEGYVEKIPDEEMILKDPVYYMPHHAIFTSKCRIVFDASARSNGELSLNDALEQGPNLNPEVLELLIRFRMHPTAIVADIEAAFLQISIAPEFRDLLRFICRDTNGSLIHARFTRCPFGVKPCPFLLAATLRHHFATYEGEHPELAALLSRDFYVDDLLTGGKDTQEIMGLIEESVNLLKSGGFNLTKWRSSSQEVQAQLVERGLAHCDTSGSTKLLGLHWQTETDVLHFNVIDVINRAAMLPSTKRTVIKVSAQLFDPAGWLSPFTIRAKILFQALWEGNIPWDMELPPESRQMFEKWVAELNELSAINVPRRYFGKQTEIHLHVFCDASSQAYGACVFMRNGNPHQPGETALVVAKSRVKPLKQNLTVPRLELMGAVIGARLANYVTRSLTEKPVSITFWTDSQIVLHWVTQDGGAWSPFVSHRVREIRESTEPDSWRFCPGNQNPADYLTRGLSASNLVQSLSWWSGPAWLRGESVDWPEVSLVGDPLEEQGKEEVVVTGPATVPCEVVRFDRFSQYRRLKNSLAFVQRFVDRLRGRAVLARELRPKLTLLSPQEVAAAVRECQVTLEDSEKAERKILQIVQQESFESERAAVVANKKIPTSSPLKGHSVFIGEDGLLRVNTRLDKAQWLKYEERFPIILPKSHPVVKMLIVDIHHRRGHCGTADVLTHMRNSIWLIRGRQVIKSVLGRCVVCRRLRGKPVTQPVGSLPENRVTPAEPFEISGVDYAGPLFYILGKQSRKAWISLFTCAVTRACHLEVVTSLEPKAFISSIIRFRARRGACRVLYCDNARTFTAAEKELAAVWNVLKSQPVSEYFVMEAMEFRHIPPRAAHWGGFWERMVKIVKDGLRRHVGNKKLGLEELMTTLTEIESIVNSRPLTYVESDPHEPLPLTPGHFLCGRRQLLFPSLQNAVQESTQLSLGEHWRKREEILRSFWDSFKRHYLLQLRSANLKGRQPSAYSISEGDIVIVNDSRVPRLQWRLARIVEVKPGSDGVVRTVKLELPGGRQLVRPNTLIYPLEVVDRAGREGTPVPQLAPGSM